jgi:hypothetical protein
MGSRGCWGRSSFDIDVAGSYKLCAALAEQRRSRRSIVQSRNDEAALAYYNELRARDRSHNAALRQLGNRLVDILHGCLKTGTLYNQATAWSHRYQHLAA